MFEKKHFSSKRRSRRGQHSQYHFRRPQLLSRTTSSLFSRHKNLNQTESRVFKPYRRTKREAPPERGERIDQKKPRLRAKTKGRKLSEERNFPLRAPRKKITSLQNILDKKESKKTVSPKAQNKDLESLRSALRVDSG